jgi:hypothetical protein
VEEIVSNSPLGVTVGDINLRVRNLLPQSITKAIPSAHRFTLDPHVSTRGRDFLTLCNELDLVPLNGLVSLPGMHHLFTSFQLMGSAVVDHAFVRDSLGFYPWGSVGFIKCSAQHVRNMRN